MEQPTFEISGKPKSKKIPKPIEDDLGLEDKDVLILKATPQTGSGKIQLWVHLTSGREFTIPAWLNTLWNADSKFADLDVKIVDVISWKMFDY